MKVRDAMTTEVCLTDPDRSVREAAETMADQDIGALPIGENDRLVGMITDRDIAVRGGPRARPGNEDPRPDVAGSDVLLRG